jgi:hypothetical protein
MHRGQSKKSMRYVYPQSELLILCVDMLAC